MVEFTGFGENEVRFLVLRTSGSNVGQGCTSCSLSPEVILIYIYLIVNGCRVGLVTENSILSIAGSKLAKRGCLG